MTSPEFWIEVARWLAVGGLICGLLAVAGWLGDELDRRERPWHGVDQRGRRMW